MPFLSQAFIVLVVFGVLASQAHQTRTTAVTQATAKNEFIAIQSIAAEYRQENCSTIVTSMSGSDLAADGVDMSEIENPSNWLIEFHPSMAITYDSSNRVKKIELMRLGGLETSTGEVVIIPTPTRSIDNKNRYAFIGAQQADQCL